MQTDFHVERVGISGFARHVPSKMPAVHLLPSVGSLSHRHVPVVTEQVPVRHGLNVAAGSQSESSTQRTSTVGTQPYSWTLQTPGRPLPFVDVEALRHPEREAMPRRYAETSGRAW